MPDRKGTFYSPWPVIDGKPLNLQWGEIRSNQAELKALARNSFQELGTGDELNALRALLGQTYGDLVNNDRYRLLYDKSTQEFCVQRNDNFTDPPTWVDVWCIRPSDGQFQVTSEGGILSSAGFYGPGLKEIQRVADSRDLGTPTDDDVTIECTDRILFDRCSGLKVRRIASGPHTGAPEVTFTAPFGRSQVFLASGQEWVIQHDFGAGPQLVQVMDSDDRVIIPDKADVSDPNTAYFYFHDTVVGSVIVATGGLGAVELRPKDPFYLVVRTEDKPAAGRVLRPNADLIFDSEFFYVNANEDVPDGRRNPNAVISLNSEIFYVGELKDVTVTHPVTSGHVLMWEEQCAAFIPQVPKSGAMYINDLKDVVASNPAGGNFIHYDAPSGDWTLTAGIRSGFLHTQAAASVEWTALHGQNSEVVIAQVYDTSDQQVFPDVQDVSDPNIAYFYFTEAVAGKAFIIPTGPAGIANDHGSLSGLLDNEDHPQFSLLDGTRAYTGEVEFADGSLGTPGIRFASDLDLGISRAGPNRLLIQGREVSATYADGSESVFTADKKGFTIPGQSKAQAFYLANGGSFFRRDTADNTFLDFQFGNRTVLRAISSNELLSGTNAQVGVSMSHTINGTVTEAFRMLAVGGAANVPGTVNWHLLERSTVVNRLSILGPGLRDVNDSDKGIPVQAQLVLHRDGKIAMGYRTQEHTAFYYHLNSNGPVLARDGFYVTDTVLADKRERGPRIRASLETSGLFMSGKGKWDDFGLESEKRVLAPAFYLTTSGTVVNDLAEDFISFQIGVPTRKSFFFDSDAVFPYEVLQASVRCQSGSAIAGFYIRAEGEGGNGVSVVGLDPFYIGPIRRRVLSTGDNVVNVGSELFMSIFETSSAIDITGTVKLRRRGAA